MAFLVGLPLRIAAEWVKGLKGSGRLQAFEALTLCDPYGVAKVPPTVQTLALALHWHYHAGILLIPAWPLRPANPNVRLSWLQAVDARIGDTIEGQAIARSLAVAWGGVYYPQIQLHLPDEGLLPTEGTLIRTDPSTDSTYSISTPDEPLIPRIQPLFPEELRERHFPVPVGARLVHGVHGDYYALTGKLVYPEPFERFWKAYPKPVEKAEAFGVYLAMDPDPEEQERIIQGALRYAANPYTHADGQKHIPYPQRWLRRRRFEDEDVVILCRTHQEISDHLESRTGGVEGLRKEDYV
jgi:hypothetical protein